MAPASLDDLRTLIMSRRSAMPTTGDDDVPLALVQDLCELAMWAPNHRRTWPWRFALVVGEGRTALGDAFVDDIAEAGWGEPAKMQRTRRKYLRAPVVVLVGSAADARTSTHRENMFAVAAGVQNLLLGATAAGLSAFWESPPMDDSPRVLRLCGFDADVTLVAVIYLGWSADRANVPTRPELRFTLVDG